MSTLLYKPLVLLLRAVLLKLMCTGIIWGFKCRISPHMSAVGPAFLTSLLVMPMTAGP